MLDYEIINADIVIAGGGYGGLLSAIGAREQGMDVVVLEKAFAGNSGSAKFGAGDIHCWLPEEDDLNEWVLKWSKAGDFLCNPDWLRTNFVLGYELVQKLDNMGMPFLKIDGKYKRKHGRGLATNVLCNFQIMLDKLRRECLRLGVKIIDRTPVFELLVNENGEGCGVVGMNIRDNKYIVVQSRAIVLAQGACAYKGPYFGIHMVTGDGMAMAYRHGAAMESMEYGNKYQSTYIDFNIYGMSRFQRNGGIFRNKFGEKFMVKYDPEFKDGTTLDNLVRGMATEVRAGKGPITFSLEAFSEDDKDVSRKLLGPVLTAAKSENIDLFGGPLEWIPAFTGNMGASPAGLKVNGTTYQTTIPHVYAVGDSCCRSDLMGATIGTGGTGLMYAGLSGYHSGRYSAFEVKEGTFTPHVKEKQIKKAVAQLEGLLNREEGLDAGEVLYELQSLVFDTEVNALRAGDRLKKALGIIKDIQEKAKRTTAKNYHELMFAHEVVNMALIGETTIASALAREESRGGHYREDFPNKDNENWLKRVQINLTDGGQGYEITFNEMDREPFKKLGILA